MKTRGGITYSKRVDIAYGHPRNPISPADIIAKFRDCTGYSARPLSPAVVEEVIHRVTNLENEPDVRTIIRMVS